MKLHIPRDVFDNPTPPRLILCQTNKEKIGELPAYDVQLNAKWNAYSELSFTINRMYNDILTGETKVHPLFDLAEGLRKVYVEGFGYFVIQDPDLEYSDNETKKFSCFSIEYETGQKYLENFFVNTGEEDSIEVIYYTNTLGEDYFNMDKMYTKVTDTDKFDEYEQYYIRLEETNDEDNINGYNYEREQVVDDSDFASKISDLYVASWPNVRFYYPTHPELSLLDLIFKKIPEWTIGHVDSGLYTQEGKFEQSRVAVYDFLMNDVCDKFKCVIEWDTINMKVNFYEEEEDGITEDGNIQTRFNTDVFISRDNLANSINIKYSTDDIKTKLKVTGGDDLDIREVNLGQNYILNLDYYHTVDWMGQELYDKYGKYKKLLEEYEPKYKELMQQWVKSYNIWKDLMYQIPKDDSVIAVGEEFKKLYCTYKPVIKDGASEPTTEAINAAVAALKKKLVLLGVDEDTEGLKTDNILLTLKKDDSSATVRVYCSSKDGANVNFKVRVEITKQDPDTPTTSIKTVSEKTLKNWVQGIDASDIELSGFKIKYIGTAGVYLCMSRDESKEEELEDYGYKLLQERLEVYKTLFITQTENLMSQVSDKDKECTISATEPSSPMEGMRWLNIDVYPIELKEYTRGVWKDISLSKDIKNLTGYELYKDNYNRLITVQRALQAKEVRVARWLNGYKANHPIITDEAISETLAKPDGEERLRTTLRNIAINHFKEVYEDGNYDFLDEKDMEDFNPDIPTYKFKINHKGLKKTTSYIVYLKNGVPYVSYRRSQGVLQARMERIKEKVDMESYFNEDDWMRLSPFIKEDEFTDSNIALNGYESEEHRLELYEELKKNAEKELKSISRPSLEFSMDMANILAIPEFDPIKEHFALGNFVTVGIRPDYIKKARLLEVSLDFEDISSLKATFGNLVTTRSEIDKHAELLKQAVTAGKSVAANANNWQKAVKKTNAIDEAINEGLKDAVLEVGAAYGQNITWDQYGIWGRKLIDGSTDTYEDEQFKIINNKILFSDDSFKTAKALFGKFNYDADKDGVKETHWGVLADALVGGYIEGSEISGGTINIGNGSFTVDETGKVTIGGGSKVGDMTVQDIQAYISDESNVVYGTCPIHGNYLADEIWIVGDNDYIQTTENGNMVNNDGKVIAPVSMGSISDDETLVLDSENNPIGKILDGVVFDNNDNIIGVYDSGRKQAFSIVGYIEDGDAVDSTGTSIGTISGYIVMNDDTLVGLIIRNYIVSSEITTETVDVNIVAPGSVLRSAKDGNGVYKSTDWVSALKKYDDQHDDLNEDITGVRNNLNQHFDFTNSDGLVIKDDRSNIYTQFRNDRWAFMQKAQQGDTNGDVEVAYISNEKLYISSAEIGINETDGDLDVHGSATVKELSIDSDYSNKSLTIRAETNGSFSILIETK